MGKRPALTRGQIIAKAIAIADGKGIDALSMRKLAGELNIQAMSLYHHFKTKDEIIAGMAEQLVTEIDFGVPDDDAGTDWRTIMLSRALSAKTLFRKHAWLPFVLDSQIQSGVKRLEYLNNYIGTLRKAGFPIDLAIKVTSLIDSYIYGYCRQLSHVADTEKSREKLAEDFASMYDAEDFPYLAEATTLMMKQGYDEEADFLYGLNIILSGISINLPQ
jgi:AcrR family transcriptional regulator